MSISDYDTKFRRWEEGRQLNNNQVGAFTNRNIKMLCTANIRKARSNVLSVYIREKIVILKYSVSSTCRWIKIDRERFWRKFLLCYTLHCKKQTLVAWTFVLCNISSCNWKKTHSPCCWIIFQLAVSTRPISFKENICHSHVQGFLWCKLRENYY